MFQWPLLITLGVAHKKPEGGKRPPPPTEDRVNQCSTVPTTFTKKGPPGGICN